MKLDAKVWLDGKMVLVNKAVVPLYSHAVGRGSAIFEFLTCHSTPGGTMLFRPMDYIRRFGRSAKFIGMKLPYGRDKLLDTIKTVVRTNRISNGIVKMIAFWPGIEFEVLPQNPQTSLAVIAINMMEEIYKGRRIKFDKPLRAKTVSVRKLDPRTAPVEAKVAANYLNAMLAKREAVDGGADVPIMLDVKGCLAEGATESIFLVQRGKLITPRLENILPSITRDSVLKIARNLKIPTFEQRIKPIALETADEAFFSSSSMKIWPVSHIDGKKVGKACPGPVSAQLREAIKNIINGKNKTFANWLTPV